MAELNIGGWRIEFDREATASGYARFTGCVGDRCDCVYCRNYEAAIAASMGESVRSLLERFGIDDRRPAETCEYGPDAGLHLYGVWWHVVGRILGDPGDQPAKVVAPNRPESSISFSHRADMAHEPLRNLKPLVQLDLMLYLPWVLPEPYPESE